MIELIKSPSMSVLSKGRFALWLAVSLVFAALLFAAGAQAQETNATEGAAETPTGEAATSGAPEEVPSVVEQAPPATEQAPPVAEQAPAAAEEAPPAAEQVPPAVEEAPPAAEEAPPTAEQAPPAADEAPPTAEQAPPVSDEAPAAPEQAPPVADETPTAVEQAPPAAQEAPPVIEKKTVEQTAGGVTAEAGSEATQGPGEDSQVPADTSGLTHKEATGEATPETYIALTTSVAPAFVSEISTSPAQDQAHPSGRQTISTQRTGQMTCVTASITAGYAGSWLDISVASSVSDVLFATVNASSTTIAASAPAGSLDSGSSTTENRPPAPGSGSGGAGGGSAAGGGSGSTSSASSTLVDVLRQAAPRAMRRLRIAQPSWRTSFFVLIPERPD